MTMNFLTGISRKTAIRNLQSVFSRFQSCQLQPVDGLLILPDAEIILEGAWLRRNLGENSHTPILGRHPDDKALQGQK
jgi:hypothetical protein